MPLPRLGFVTGHRERSDPNAYMGEIVLAYQQGDREAIINCVTKNFHQVLPGRQKTFMEALMGKGENEQQKARIKAYFEAQAKQLKEDSGRYERMAKGLEE